MAAFRQLVAPLLALALVFAAAGIVFASANAPPGCPMKSNAVTDDGCCRSAGGMADCGMGCASSFVVSNSNDATLPTPDPAGALQACDSAQAGRVARPPDTAPPKFLSA